MEFCIFPMPTHIVKAVHGMYPLTLKRKPASPISPVTGLSDSAYDEEIFRIHQLANGLGVCLNYTHTHTHIDHGKTPIMATPAVFWFNKHNSKSHV